MGKDLNEKALADLKKNIPLGRLGQPEEFAQSVLSIFENGYINGTYIRLDGALRMGYL